MMNGLCLGQCDICCERIVRQPFGVEMYLADGIMAKQMVIPDADTLVPQHVHKYDHTSLLVFGKVEVFVDGKSQGVRTAPDGIFIKSGVAHSFRSLVPGTMIFCLHNISRSGKIESEPPSMEVV
jgi:hypothetical protein